MGDQSNPPIPGAGVEVPVHSVTVSAFYVQNTLVSAALWDEVKSWGSTNGYTDLPVGRGKATNHPVQTVTWYAVVKWCNARSEKEGLTPCYTVSGATYKTGSSAPDCNWSANGYRLPSEAEWEKAARGGLVGLNFPWGDTISQTQANYLSRTSNRESYDVSPTSGYDPRWNDGVSPYTSPVGSFAANDYGLCDMVGNVWEWCWDWWASYAASPTTDPQGPATGASRTNRGGEWGTYADTCLVHNRNNNAPNFANSRVGFRVACGAVP